jgi:putative FmdB family regulatory protein
VPIYEYLCKKCGHKFEKIQKFSDRLIKKCPECCGPVEQTITAPAVQFKGTGWYVTDYAKKDGKDKAASSGSKETGSSSEKSDSKEKGDSKDSHSKESRDSKETKEAKESTGSKESKEAKESKTIKPGSRKR